MLNISKDESIHSAIFRTHVVNGVGDFSNIITSKGGWSTFPKILEGTLHNYGLVDEFQFLILLRDIGVANETNKMFENPVKYREDLERFFGYYEGNRRRFQYSFQIRYCLSCIKEHIKEFGYGIFKLTWLTNNHCPVHNSPLYFSTESSRNSGVEAVKNIFCGEHPKNHSTLNEISDYFYDSRKYSYSTTVDYFTPCLEDKLYKFIMENSGSFPESTFDKHCYIGCWRTPSYMIVKIYNALKKNSALVLKDFLNNQVETMHINTGVINRQSIKEKVFKDNEKDCQSCKYLFCFTRIEKNSNIGR